MAHPLIDMLQESIDSALDGLTANDMSRVEYYLDQANRAFAALEAEYVRTQTDGTTEGRSERDA